MIRSLLLLIAVLLAGLHAGFFFTWSFSVMNGLDAATPETAIAAMQSMNENIRNGPFGIVFFGAPAVALLAAIIAFASRRGMPAFLALIGFIALATTIVITATLHVPLNDALAVEAIPADPATAKALWMAYAGPWTEWNHLRALSSLLGCLFLVLAFRTDRRP
jgi:uncharacterized membrane protein